MIALLCAASLALGACGPGSVIYGSPDWLNVHEKAAAPFGSGVVYEEDELGGVYIVPNGIELTVTGSIISTGDSDNANRIRVAEGAVAALILKSVTIDFSAVGWEHLIDTDAQPIPIEVGKGAILTLKLDGTSVLRGGINAAGVKVPEGAALFVTSAAGDGETDGVLNAEGGLGGAGIGGMWGFGAGEITISGGTVNAGGGASTFVDAGGAGIGGGYYGSGGKITIKGGVVDAKGGYMCAGIGAGETRWVHTSGTIEISGGVVNALGWGGAGIGGSQRGNVDNIRITGGSGKAESIKASGYGLGHAVGPGDGGNTKVGLFSGPHGPYDEDGWPTDNPYEW
ncbi:MAG: hypothetical protein MdMp014T_0948 [Treponematales bacterium]